MSAADKVSPKVEKYQEMTCAESSVRDFCRKRCHSSAIDKEQPLVLKISA